MFADSPLLALLAGQAHSFLLFHGCVFWFLPAAQTAEAKDSRTRAWRRVVLLLWTLRLQRVSRSRWLLPATARTAAGFSQASTARYAKLEAVDPTPAAWLLFPRTGCALLSVDSLCFNKKTFNQQLSSLYPRKVA